MSGLDDCAAWETLRRLRARLSLERTRAWQDTPGRFKRLGRRVGGVYFDASRQLVDDAIVDALMKLASERGVEDFMRRLFEGERVNETEARAVLHPALRAEAGDAFVRDGQSLVPAVLAERERMFALARSVRAGEIVGATGKPIDTVINVGIGGSHLGPAMLVHALAGANDGPDVRFVSNVDGAALDRALVGADPERTLFVVVSKSFGTAETLLNAASARAWLVDALDGVDVSAHFVAVTARPERARSWGATSILALWPWVGGRFSMWSSAGFAVAVAIGTEAFAELLAGARVADRHVRESKPRDDVALWMALLDVWNHNVGDVHSRAVVPYDERLALLPAYLQQAEMESNGKSTRLDGRACSDATGPVVWGAPGTDAQHAFFQLLHQGTQVIATDFIVAARPGHQRPTHHRSLLANCVAQSRALAWGRTADEAVASMMAEGIDAERARALATHRSFPGMRPSTTFVLDRLDARTMGTLVALFEHAVAFKGALWGVPSFDQWGVELGKVMAAQIEGGLSAGSEGDGRSDGGPDADLDATTRALLDMLRER